MNHGTNEWSFIMMMNHSFHHSKLPPEPSNVIPGHWPWPTSYLPVMSKFVFHRTSRSPKTGYVIHFSHRTVYNGFGYFRCQSRLFTKFAQANAIFPTREVLFRLGMLYVVNIRSRYRNNVITHYSLLRNEGKSDDECFSLYLIVLKYELTIKN